jgi:hypothetical protein
MSTPKADVEVSASNTWVYPTVKQGDLVIKTTASNGGVFFGYSTATSNVLFGANNRVVMFGTSNAGVRIEDGRFMTSSNAGSNAPGYTWCNNTNTGMFLAAGNAIGFSMGGSNVISMSNGSVILGSNYSYSTTYMDAFRNKLINGDFRINQRCITTLNVGSTGLFDTFSLDKWRIYHDNGASTGYFSITQCNASGLTGFNSSLRLVNTASTTKPTWNGVNQNIEGYLITDMNWGTSLGVPATLSFWVRSSVTGSFGAIVTNYWRDTSATGHSFGALYTINNANTWEYKQVPVTAPPSNTVWDSSSNAGICLLFTFTQSGSQNANGGYVNTGWNAVKNVWGVTGQTDLTLVNGASWEVTGVQFEKGTYATPFNFRKFDVELARCMRYYEKSYPYEVAPGTALTVGTRYITNMGIFLSQYPYSHAYYRVSKRASCTLTLYNESGTSDAVAIYGSTSGSTGIIIEGNTENQFTFTSTTISTKAGFYIFAWTATAEI